MTLNEYLAESGKRPAELAETLGISEASLSRLRNGKQNPSLNLAAAIERETAGRVPAIAWASEAA